MNRKKVISLTIATLLLQGCVPALFVGGAGTVTSSVAEERGITGALSDTSIKSRINLKWMGYDGKIGTMVELSVREGRVLLSGRVDTAQRHIDAVRLVWEVDGVKEVIDHIEEGEGHGLKNYIGDSWTTTKVKTALLGDREIHSNNYSVKTVNGVVYLMGIARSREELELALTKTRNIRGVEKVISYVRIKEKVTTPDSAMQAARSQSSQTSSSSYAPSAASSTSEPVGVENLDQPNADSSFD